MSRPPHPGDPPSAEAFSSPEITPLAEKAARLPHLPGVYLFKGAGTILYVGKAKDLRKRVANYFRSGRHEDVKTRTFLAKADDLEYLVTGTEKEALLLEAGLIKKHRPRYNVVLRDDKSYPSLRIDLHEPFPRLTVVRRFQKDGAHYFGPYPSAHAVRETLKVVNQLFPLRQCKGRKLQPRRRPCLNHSLGRCLGACAGRVSQEEYRKAAREVVLFLQGKTDALQRDLRQKMEDAAANLEYERAARYRDQLQGVEAVLEKQHIVSEALRDQDVLAIRQEVEAAMLLVLSIRRGVVVGRQDFDLGEARGDTPSILRSFIQQYYGGGRFIPDEIIVPDSLEDAPLLEDWLRDLRGKRSRIIAPQRGPRKVLLDMAVSNLLERFESHRRTRQRNEHLLSALQRILRLPRPPRRMACVDISNVQGLHAVGAVAVFVDGRPERDAYRHYRVRERSEPDDPAMMAEVVRRFFQETPANVQGLDLLVLDGGKGQLNRILRLFGELGLESAPPVVAMAKEREGDRKDRGRGLYEKFYIPGRKNPISLAHTPDVLHLLQRLRNEAHRFAVSSYQHRHGQDLLASVLDDIAGVGGKRKQLLLNHFPSLEALRNATVEELQRLPGISERLAETIAANLGGKN